VLILAAGAGLRFYGLNWDGGQWLHPDERQIYFVANDLQWPGSLAEALSPESPLNPGFFAYGSWPIYLLRVVAALLAAFWPALRDPGNLHLAGRPLAALFDLGTVFLTYRLARALWPGFDREAEGNSEGQAQRFGLLAAALVCLAVLHVQLAHFYTVDPILTFFVVLTLYLAAGVARGAGRATQIGLGVALGLALATKVSTAPLALAVPVAYSLRRKGQGLPATAAILGTLGALALALVVFFLVQPYALIDWPTFVEDTVREAQIARGNRLVPFTMQYAGTLPYLYSAWQTALWALALPLGLVAWTGLGASLIRWLRRGLWADALLLAWAGPSLAAAGLLYTRYLRYMLPLVPVLCILGLRVLDRTAWLQVTAGRRRLARIGLWAVGLASLAYALLFSSIYSQPHSWISASAWIYQQIPAGQTLAVEHWDMSLPLPLELEGRSRRQNEYDVRLLPLYDEPDDAAKWAAVAADLADSDYVILASRRLYGSIPRLPGRYPVATRYYERLLAGELGFQLAGEFSRGPAWLNPRIPPLPDPAPAALRPDESFVVYDHPRVLILRNAEHLPASELLRRLEIP